MSQSFDSNLEDLVILSGATSSRVVDAEAESADAAAIMIYGPVTLAESVVIAVSYDNVTFVTLHDGTADIASPLAGKARQYTELQGAKYWKLLAGGAVAADRTFKVAKNWVA